jgi:hypothetical protein
VDVADSGLWGRGVGWVHGGTLCAGRLNCMMKRLRSLPFGQGSRLLLPQTGDGGISVASI